MKCQAYQEQESNTMLKFENLVKNGSNIEPIQLQKLLLDREWNISEFLIKSYFLPRNIDLYPTFVQIKKKIPQESYHKLDYLINLLPRDSPSLKK